MKCSIMRHFIWVFTVCQRTYLGVTGGTQSVNYLPTGEFCMLSCRLLFFFQNQTFSKDSFRNTLRVSNSLDTDQARHIVGPDLGSNCLKRLSADDTRRQRVKNTSTLRVTRSSFYVVMLLLLGLLLRMGTARKNIPWYITALIIGCTSTIVG